MKKVLFVTSEAHPLIKTGGLADVSGSLPKALAELSQDVRLIIPKYQALKISGELRYVCSLRVDNKNVKILETRMPGSPVTVWLVDYPGYFNYPGNPYVDELGEPWPNNAERFALFCRTVVEVAMDRVHQDWKPDVVHCNDWQSGLVPALLSLEYDRPSTVFTIHNMAYQGLFPGTTAATLNMPGQLMHPLGLEFHSMLSFIKGGLVYSDYITTVSPTYALEIQTPEFGYGLEGLLDHRKEFLGGIINGIDLDQWNPKTDTLISQNFTESTLSKKQVNKSALQKKMGLPVNGRIPLFGLIGRLVEQKGIDLILDSLPEMLTMPLQFVLLGSGDKAYEKLLEALAQSYPDKIALNIGYNEELAHSIEAGADIFLMPSRFEPCGLNQMYSQRYGTIPIVRKTGGLADTVVDALPHTIADNTATGIIFNEATAGSLLESVKRALLLYSNAEIWIKLQTAGMKKDFSWQQSAQRYLAVYNNL
ncbi:MAG: glycogen synthase GlgA [Methylococcaceae bacterium]|nr:glycogen synthase GlgA [Methylococcaceae bacterium]